MKVAIILVAVFYMHIARGSPVEPNAKTQDAARQANPNQEPQAAPAAPAKPETCTANINGTEQTLKPGDRYCLNEHTHRVCNYGDWIDGECDPGSTCLKSPTSWQVLCRIVIRNPPQNPPPGAEPQNDNANSNSNANSNANANSNPSPPQPSNPAPAPSNPEPSNPAPAPSNPEPSNPAPAQPNKPETCKATIDGREQTLQPGDRYCLNDSTNRVCNYGEFVDFQCPSGSQCLKSPTQWQVLCRVVNKNAPQNVPSSSSA